MKRTADDAELPADRNQGVPEWQPAPGESPAEREKRIKREKRAAKLALEQGGAAQANTALAGTQSGSNSALLPGADTGWRPAPGESPAEREKRIKREKRAAKLAELGQGSAAGGAHTTGYTGAVPPPPSSAYPSSYHRPETEDSGDSSAPHVSATGAPAIHPSRLATAPALADSETNKSRNAQAKTAARLKYLQRKKDRAKARKASAPKHKDKGRSTSVVSASVAGGEGSEDENGEEAMDDSAAASSALASGTSKTPEQLAEIARKKEERRIKRLEKKAELKRIKESGGVVPPPRPKLNAPKATPAAKVSKVEEKAERAEPLAVPGNTEEDERKIREAEEAAEAERQKQARKEAKRAKRAARREAEDGRAQDEGLAQAEDDGDEDAKMEGVTLDPFDPINAAEAAEETATTQAQATLYRLPSATKPAPPSAKVLSSLRVHEAVRYKVVVDPELRVPFSEEDSLGISSRGRRRLAEMGIESAFAVQTAIFPLLLSGENGGSNEMYRPFQPLRDICVSAPTGSGKTLSYVVPLVETLSSRIVPRLRALILLPTRDLVGQVRETFEQYAKGTGLRVGTAAGGGSSSFASEGTLLLGESGTGAGAVDILIATPGRLMDHLNKTEGFSLAHLRFLVVDEADRLLTQSFHDWLPSILQALKPKSDASASELLPSVADPLAPEVWDHRLGRIESDVDFHAHSSCQKLLFSATLSRDPAKIDALHLHRPIYISVEDALDPHAEVDEAAQGADDDDEAKFTFPAQLEEHMIVSPSMHKPLYLFHLLHELKIDRALCFTKSVEAAARLAKLVEFFEEARQDGATQDTTGKSPVVVKSYSSELPPAERNRILTSFKKGEIQMLICSDLISRGIDLPHVSHVISYDIPADMRKYVHRVGRTARAGNKGDAWSLVEDQEAAPFKSIMKRAQHWSKIKRVRVKDQQVEGFLEPYQTALEKLKAYFATGQTRKNVA